MVSTGSAIVRSDGETLEAQTPRGDPDGPSLTAILPIAVSSKLGVSGAETEQKPVYLRPFFRVLSNWVHPCDVSGHRAHVSPIGRPYYSMLSAFFIPAW